MLVDLTKPYKIIIDGKVQTETPDIIDLKHGKVMTCEGNAYNITDVQWIPQIYNEPSFSQRII